MVRLHFKVLNSSKGHTMECPGREIGMLPIDKISLV
jgi:hypothetical protein